MAKSMRSKREKRLRAIRREIVQKEAPYQMKEDAKLAALAAALAAPKLPVRAPASTSMDVAEPTPSNPSASTMDVEMADNGQNKGSLKPVGGIGKKSKRKFKVGRNKRCGKGKVRGKHNL